MWSSISSPIRALRDPRAAARRCRMSAQCASSSMACRVDSNWPISFLVRETRSSFSWVNCDILVDYPRGVWYQENVAACKRGNTAGERVKQMKTPKQEPEPPRERLRAMIRDLHR